MYQLHQHGVIREDGAFIPADPDNTDYAAYLRWVAEGNTPEPYEAPPLGVPQEVTMRQARLALSAAGLLAAVDAAISAMPEPQKTGARIEWEYSGAVQRNKPLVLALAPALGLTEAQIDELFIQAAAL
jgi:hypothetical protein